MALRTGSGEAVQGLFPVLFVFLLISSMNRSSTGKSSRVLGAEMFAWMSMSPHERWNMRREKGPCDRVTWL